MKTRLANGMVLGFLFAASSAWVGQSPPAVSTDEGQQITIGVYDYAQAGLGILLKAERVADGIFKNVGVSITWLACSTDKTASENPGCADLSSPLKIIVRIEPDFMAKKFQQTNDVFGFAAGIEDGEFPRDVWIFYDQVKEFAVDKRLFVSPILGSLIAHELGHLLLGANSHSRSGLMCAVWARNEVLAANLGGLHFSNSERTRSQNSVSARYQAQGHSISAQQVPAAGSSLTSLEMPFQLVNGYLIVVEGRIGDLTGLKFILDTGVTTSVLGIKTAAKLKLSGRPNHVINFGKTVPVELSTIPEVRFGPVQARNVEMFIGNLEAFSDFARGMDALIGVDLLQLNNLTFDYDTRRVLFSPIDHNNQGTQMRPEPTCFTVRVQVQGHPIDLLLDTGLEGMLLYEDRIRAHVRGLRMEPGVKKVTIGRRMSAKLATLPEMRLGPTVMDGRVLLIKGPPVNMLDGLDGYIGIAPFHPTRIAFDFVSKTLRWD